MVAMVEVAERRNNEYFRSFLPVSLILFVLVVFCEPSLWNKFNANWKKLL